MKAIKVVLNANQTNEGRCINLEYLYHCAKSNRLLVKEMILLYIEQIPPIMNAMNQSLAMKDWIVLRATMHKLLPSFSIVGIDGKYEKMAKMVQDCASLHDSTGQIKGLALQVENICRQACRELEEELNIIK